MTRLNFIRYSTLILVFFFARVIPAYAQRTDKPYLDSLEAALRSTGHDTIRCHTLNRIVESLFRKEDYTAALPVVDEAIKLSEALQDSFWIANGYKSRAAIRYRKGDATGAVEDCFKALPIAERHDYTKIALMSMNILSVIYGTRSQYDEALIMLFRAIEISEAHNNIYQSSVLFTNMGFLYYHLKNPEKATECCIRALALKRQINDRNDLDMLYYNISNHYVTLGNIAKATENLRMAYTCQPTHENSFYVTAQFVQARIDLAQKKLDEAHRHFMKSYELAKKCDYQRFQVESAIFIAQYYLEKDDLKQAREYIRIGLELAPGNALNELNIALYQTLAKLHEKSGDFKTACAYLDKYNTISDSTFNNNLAQNVMVVHAIHDQRDNKARLNAQNEMLALKQKAIERQETINILIVVSLMLLFILILLFYRSYRSRKKINHLLEQKVRERNYDLLQGYESLRQWQTEQRTMFRSMLSDVRGSLDKIKSASTTALQDATTTSEQEYLRQVVITTDKIAEVTARLPTDFSS